LQAIDEKTTKLSQGFLASDLEILSTIGEHINELVVEE
jgi:hypothetical protein